MSAVAVLTPLPPERSGIADYAAALVPAMGRRCDLLAVAGQRPDPLPGVTVARAGRPALRRARRAQAVIAHIGNNADYHGWILDAIRGRPATVVLHDVVLHHLVAGATIGRRRPDEYVAAMQEEAGSAGRVIGQGVVDGTLPGPWTMAPEVHPLTRVALRDASAVIVHSAHAAAAVRARRPDLPVHVVPHPRLDDGAATPERLPGEPFPVIGFFGFVTREKRLPVIVRALARLRSRFPRARLLVVGTAPPQLAVERLTAEAGLDADAVQITGFVGGDRLRRLIATTDIGVALRHPTMGETSGTVIRLLAAGVPTIVSPGGWYDELPDDAVVRVAPGADEEAALAGALDRLAGDAEDRRRRGAAARRHIGEDLDPDRIAEAHLRIALGAAGRPAVRERLLTDLALRVDEVAPGDARSVAGLSADLAARLHELSLA